MGISHFTLANIEAGRRACSGLVLLRLEPLAEHLPPTPPSLPAVAEPPAAAPHEEPLRWRIAECQHEARQLRWELREVCARLDVARRWQQALPALLAAEPFRPKPGELARLPLQRRWLQHRGEDAADAMDGAAAARYHLLTARAEALEAEAAALLRLLPAP